MAICIDKIHWETEQIIMYMFILCDFGFFRCSLCKEIFDSKVNIQVHFAIKHSNECKLYKCTKCDSVFRSEMEWEVHVRVNHLHVAKPYRYVSHFLGSFSHFKGSLFIRGEIHYAFLSIHHMCDLIFACFPVQQNTLSYEKKILLNTLRSGFGLAYLCNNLTFFALKWAYLF